MKRHISELIDLPQLQRLMHSLHEATGVPYALLDDKSNILVAVGWEDICTRFHRACPATAARCSESDQYILDHVHQGAYVSYRCPQGLMDYATPVIIEGEHLADVFTGQVLNEPPDIAFFERQAERYGFDKRAYLEALARVSVVPGDQIERVMAFLVELAQLLAAEGLHRLGQLEAERDLLAAKRSLEEEVRERKKAEAAVRSYAERAMNLQQAEQRRLARELHDRVSSNLSLVGLQLQGIGEQLFSIGPIVMGDKLTDCAALVEDTLRSTRDISADLHPAILDYCGLLPALEDLAEKFARQSSVTVNVAHAGREQRLEADKELVLFRIAQEALLNCAKHSLATAAQIDVCFEPGAVRLSIRDDGIGFNTAALGEPRDHAGLGLFSMQERAAAIGGACRIESAPGKGTQVTVEVALQQLRLQ